MGLEYKIEFQNYNIEHFEKFLERLSLEIKNEVTIILEKDGIYFCDNCTNSPITSKTFYRLIREVMIYNSEVRIYEL